MGSVSGKEKDTRRISFNNTFSLNSAFVVPKSIEHDNILNIDDITTAEKNEEFDFPDTKVKEVKQVETELDYWSNRIDALKQEHLMINKIIEREYEKTLETTVKNFEPVEIHSEKYEKIKPCFDWRAKIIKCYEDNPQQPLVCSSIVQAFNNCVTSCRLEE